MENLNLKAKSRKQVALEYGISTKTLKYRLAEKRIEINPGLIYPKTLKLIYETFGHPEGLNS
jgi:hypothetical protein